MLLKVRVQQKEGRFHHMGSAQPGSQFLSLHAGTTLFPVSFSGLPCNANASDKT